MYEPGGSRASETTTGAAEDGRRPDAEEETTRKTSAELPAAGPELAGVVAAGSGTEVTVAVVVSRLRARRDLSGGRLVAVVEAAKAGDCARGRGRRKEGCGGDAMKTQDRRIPGGDRPGRGVDPSSPRPGSQLRNETV